MAPYHRGQRSHTSSFHGSPYSLLPWNAISSEWVGKLLAEAGTVLEEHLTRLLQ